MGWLLSDRRPSTSCSWCGHCSRNVCRICGSNHGITSVFPESIRDGYEDQDCIDSGYLLKVVEVIERRSSFEVYRRYRQLHGSRYPEIARFDPIWSAALVCPLSDHPVHGFIVRSCWAVYACWRWRNDLDDPDQRHYCQADEKITKTADEEQSKQ